MISRKNACDARFWDFSEKSVKNFILPIDKRKDLCYNNILHYNRFEYAHFSLNAKICAEVQAIIV